MSHYLGRLAATVLAVLPIAGAGWLIVARHELGAAAISAATLPIGLLIWHLHRQARTEYRRVLQLAAQLREAHRDPVTGLAVRVVAERFLDAARGIDLTVALIDGDDLHGINDRFGHHGGDQLLAAIARRLRTAEHPGDLLARLGGDEFLFASPRALPAVRAALAAVSSTRVLIDGELVAVRLSIGICRVPGGEHREAIARADRAMYTAKRAGGGIFTEPADPGTPAAGF